MTSDGFLTTGEVIARLRAIRRYRKLSVREMVNQACNTGLTRTIWAKAEVGKRESLPYHELVALCVVLDVDVRDVISTAPLTLQAETVQPAVTA